MDGLDLRRHGAYAYCVTAFRVAQPGVRASAGAIQLGKIDVNGAIERSTLRRTEVESRSCNGLELARGPCIDGIDQGPPFRRHMQAHLIPLATGNGKIRVPSDGHGLRRFAGVRGSDLDVDCVAGKRNGKVQIGRRGPVAAEAAGMNYPS